MIPSGVRVWIAMGHTDMRKGMPGLALLVQQSLKRDPHGGDLFVRERTELIGERVALTIGFIRNRHHGADTRLPTKPRQQGA